MPHSTGSGKPSLASSRNHTRTKKAEQQIYNGGVLREDSDDELGLEDHPWEWIYSTKSRGPSAIVGARMGNFECRLGDCVLLKAEGNKEAWIGLICDFQEEEDEDDEHGEMEMCANFMWFSTEKEIRNKAKKRTDALSNEVYITPSWDVNPLSSINGRALVMSEEAFRAKYPSGKVPRTAKEFGKVFICRRGCNTRTTTYTDAFVWEEIYRSAADILSLVERVRKQTKATRKRRRDNGYGEDVSGDVLEEPHLSQLDPLLIRREVRAHAGGRRARDSQKAEENLSSLHAEQQAQIHASQNSDFITQAHCPEEASDFHSSDYSNPRSLAYCIVPFPADPLKPPCLLGPCVSSLPPE